jgi:hypothetical protein
MPVGNIQRHPEGRWRGNCVDTCRAFSSIGETDLDQADLRRFQPFSPLGDVNDHAIPFAEAREPASFKCGDVDEHVLCAAIPSDEAVVLVGVKPLDRAGCLDRRV